MPVYAAIRGANRPGVGAQHSAQPPVHLHTSPSLLQRLDDVVEAVVLDLQPSTEISPVSRAKQAPHPLADRQPKLVRPPKTLL